MGMKLNPFPKVGSTSTIYICVPEYPCVNPISMHEIVSANLGFFSRFWMENSMIPFTASWHSIMSVPMEENISKIVGDTIAELFDMLGKGEARWIARP